MSSPFTATNPSTDSAFDATRWWRRGAWAIAAAVIATAALARQQIIVETTPAAVTLSAGYPGLVRPRDVTTLALPTPVVVKRVAVSVGDTVRAGDVIAVLDDEDARRQLQQLDFDAERARAETARLSETRTALDGVIQQLNRTLADATARLSVAQRAAEAIPARQWKDSVARAQTAYDQALTRQHRLEQLSANGVVARQELEDAQFATRVAQDDLDIARRNADAAAKVASIQGEQADAQARLAIAEQGRRLSEATGELAQARVRQAQAEALLASATERLRELTVRAPRHGMVAEVAVHGGDRVLAGAPLARIATLDPMMVDVDVPPTIVNELRRGDEAIIRVAGSTDDKSGRIRTIAPLPGEGGAHTIEIEFPNPAQALMSGQGATVRFAKRRER